VIKKEGRSEAQDILPQMSFRVPIAPSLEAVKTAAGNWPLRSEEYGPPSFDGDAEPAAEKCAIKVELDRPPEFIERGVSAAFRLGGTERWYGAGARRWHHRRWQITDGVP
jgi:hypothetical protein